MKEFDVIVVGAGPGGYVAAIRCAQLGLKVAVIEREHLGGVCLNWGCIPTKALLKSAEVYSYCKNAKEYGIKISGLEVDFPKIIERSRKIAAKLAGGVKHLLKKNNVEVIDAYARLNKDSTLSATDSSGKRKEYKYKNLILATGARPKIIPGLEPDNKLVWHYKDAMVPKTLPKKLLIVGSGAIGVEFASFYNALGSEVTLVEVQDRILPSEDAEISNFAMNCFVKKGIKIHINTSAKISKKGISDVTVELEHKNRKSDKSKKVSEKFDRVIAAVGITPNTSDLGLEHFPSIELDKGGFIKTNQLQQTGHQNIYAIGDICKAPWLAHKASHEACVTAEAIATGKAHGVDVNMIPGCTYSDPQIASIGLTEEAAKNSGEDLKIGRFPFIANGKALAMGKEDGMVKVIFNSKTGELLGAHMVGAEVTEMISALVVAKNLETTEVELMNTIFPHPTLSEMIHESVLDAYDRVIHF